MDYSERGHIYSFDNFYVTWVNNSFYYLNRTFFGLNNQMDFVLNREFYLSLQGALVCRQGLMSVLMWAQGGAGEGIS